MYGSMVYYTYIRKEGATMANHKTTISIPQSVYQYLRETSYKTNQTFSQIIIRALGAAPDVATAEKKIDLSSIQASAIKLKKEKGGEFNPVPKPGRKK